MPGIPAFLALLAENNTKPGGVIERRCQGGILTLIVVVASRQTQLQVIGEVERDLTKDRPGEVVLLVRQNPELGTRIAGINEHRGSEVFLYVVNA